MGLGDFGWSWFATPSEADTELTDGLTWDPWVIVRKEDLPISSALFVLQYLISH